MPAPACPVRPHRRRVSTIGRPGRRLRHSRPIPRRGVRHVPALPIRSRVLARRPGTATCATSCPLGCLATTPVSQREPAGNPLRGAEVVPDFACLGLAPMHIAVVAEHDLAELLPLMRAYCDFYWSVAEIVICCRLG